MNERDVIALLSSTAADTPGLDDELLGAAARLAALPGLLPPPGAAFEQQVWNRLHAAEVASQQTRRLPRWLLGRLPTQMGQPGRRGTRFDLFSEKDQVRKAWLLAPAAALLVLALLLLPGPRRAIATWMASFRLGDIFVSIRPEPLATRPQLTGATVHFADIAQAEAAIGVDLVEPAYLPAGYVLTDLEAVSHAQLPASLRPLYVQTSYRPGAGSDHVLYYLTLREYNPNRTDDMRIGEIEVESETVRQASDITLPDGSPGVLVEFEASEGDGRIVLRQVIWQHSGLTLELWSQILPADELLRIASSVR